MDAAVVPIIREAVLETAAARDKDSKSNSLMIAMEFLAHDFNIEEKKIFQQILRKS